MLKSDLAAGISARLTPPRQCDATRWPRHSARRKRAPARSRRRCHGRENADGHAPHSLPKPPTDRSSTRQALDGPFTGRNRPARKISSSIMGIAVVLICFANDPIMDLGTVHPPIAILCHRTDTPASRLPALQERRAPSLRRGYARMGTNPLSD